MILNFKTEINGKKTHFPEKILRGIEEFNLSQEPLNYGIASKNHKPKIHTIREDKGNRWHPGIMIDFFINARTKNMFRFAPRVPVISTQEIFMTRRGSMLEITIAAPGSYIGGEDFYFGGMDILGHNDGFDEYDDFSRYFIERILENGKATGKYWFKGKIIHWTNFRYE